MSAIADKPRPARGPLRAPERAAAIPRFLTARPERRASVGLPRFVSHGRQSVMSPVGDTGSQRETEVVLPVLPSPTTAAWPLWLLLGPTAILSGDEDLHHGRFSARPAPEPGPLDVRALGPFPAEVVKAYRKTPPGIWGGTIEHTKLCPMTRASGTPRRAAPESSWRPVDVVTPTSGLAFPGGRAPLGCGQRRLGSR